MIIIISNSNTAAGRTDENLTDRIDKFPNVAILNEENTYRILLRFWRQDFCVILVFVDHPVKLDSKIICTLETDLNKLF